MLKTYKGYFIVLLLWFSLVSIGSFVGWSLSSFLTQDFSDHDWGLGVFLSLLLVGLFIGLGQWVVINSRLKKVWGWIPATAIGFSFGTFISFFVIAFVGEGLLHLDNYFSIWQYAELFATLMGAGMLTGALQWLALRRKLAASLKWLLVSGFSLVIALAIEAVFIFSLHTTNYLDYSIPSQIFFSLAVGLTTGAFAEPVILRPESKIF